MSGPTQAERAARRRARGGQARRDGRGAEVWAAFWLMLHGYRVRGFRQRLGGVEADLVVSRGSVVALVEVKRRRTLDEAIHAVTPQQRDRLRRAGEALGRRSAHGGQAPLVVRLDLLAMAPGRWPVHLKDAWGGDARWP